MMKRLPAILICIFTSALLFCLPFTAVFAASTYDCAAGRHKDVVILEKQATETKDGEITYRCELCGREYIDNIPATGHKWSAWIADKVPTCTEAGRQHKTCTLHAPHDETETIPALGHRFLKDVKEPTETKDGLITYICSVCGYSYTEPYGTATGHTHEYTQSIVKEPTCTENGIKAFTCLHDGESYTETIPATGHSFGEWIIETEEKEGTDGLRYRICVSGGEREEEIIPALPEKPLFNMNDIIINSINLALIVFFSLLISPYIHMSHWYKKQQRAFLKKQELMRTEAKKYDFH